MHSWTTVLWRNSSFLLITRFYFSSIKQSSVNRSKWNGSIPNNYTMHWGRHFQRMWKAWFQASCLFIWKCAWNTQEDVGTWVHEYSLLVWRSLIYSRGINSLNYRFTELGKKKCLCEGLLSKNWYLYLLQKDFEESDSEKITHTDLVLPPGISPTSAYWFFFYRWLLQVEKRNKIMGHEWVRWYCLKYGISYSSCIS